MPSTHSGTEVEINGLNEAGKSDEFDVVAVDGFAFGHHSGGTGLSARQGDLDLLGAFAFDGGQTLEVGIDLDLVVAVGIEVGDRLGLGALQLVNREIDDVFTSAQAAGVISRACANNVVASTGVEGVVAGAETDKITALASRHFVGGCTGIDVVINLRSGRKAGGTGAARHVGGN